MAYGYRENEREEIPTTVDKTFLTEKGPIDVDPSFKITGVKVTKQNTRPVVACSLGCHVEHAAHPHPDPSDFHTAVAGAMYRFARVIPGANKPKPKFRKFVQSWLKDNMIPLSPMSDTSFETWIEKTPYPLKRKEELRKKYEKVISELKDFEEKYLKVKSFIKDETYPTYKHARVINSRTDEFKVMVGPIFQLISDELFKLPYFIKKIPIQERPDYIINMLYQVGVDYMTTDYTSFEAHFDKNIVENCEMQLYDYMTQHLPQHKIFMQLLAKAKYGTPNKIVLLGSKIQVKCKRMSGEMDTSLANGFSNLMFMLYLCDLNGNTNVRGVIEGDDGLFAMTGAPPDQEMFKKFGLNIKILNVKDINHASFCGMVFDITERTNVTNPIEALISFGWTTRRYAKSKLGIHMCLLRAKALSAAYQYPSCPILSKLAYKICQLTASYDSLSFIKKQGQFAVESYRLKIMLEAHQYFDKNSLLKEPGIRTRLLVQDLYGIIIEDQLEIERWIDEMTTIRPITCSTITKYIRPECFDYYNHYTVKIDFRSAIDMDGFSMPSTRPTIDVAPFLKRKI